VTAANFPPVESELPDHYATLGLDRCCTLEQIRKAYRLLAKKHHPDRNAGAAEAEKRTRELNDAHETLSDPARRKTYDRELQERSADHRPLSRGRIEANISQDVHLRIDELLRGVCLTINVNDPANPEGPETYQLEVPPETAPGARFRVPRTGTFDRGVVNVRIRTRPNARFKVRGSDLKCDLRINAARAAQGGTEMIVGPLGTPIRIVIPKGAGRGEIVRVPREGLPKPRGGRGDLLVRITYRPEVRVMRMGR
jgi:DnaJ-class molecular chaperone